MNPLAFMKYSLMRGKSDISFKFFEIYENAEECSDLWSGMNAADRLQLFFRAEAPGLVISMALRTGESSPLRCSPRYRSEPGGPPFHNAMK